jgi:hypothetical protein
MADAADEKWKELKDSVEAGWDEASKQLEDSCDNLTDSI